MKRITTDEPRNNVETMLNMVYSTEDGWTRIRHGEAGVPIQDAVLSVCKDIKCNIAEDLEKNTLEDKDIMLCDCAMQDGCILGDIYCALCGYVHVRTRLKMFEDNGYGEDDVRIVKLAKELEQAKCTLDTWKNRAIRAEETLENLDEAEYEFLAGRGY